jgi:uncharacterized tellurite resistance protein B-like protein
MKDGAMMTTEASAQIPVSEPCGAAATVRRVIEQLEALEPATARHLAGLAFILTRVADADDNIQPEETVRIESILNTYASLSEEEAVLVTEIARHRRQLADCGCAYGVSRELRTHSSLEQRRTMLRYLFAVATADGRISSQERTAIVQIASELGFSRLEVESAQSQTHQA